VPVLPIVVWGTEQVITNLRHLKRSVIHVRAGPVIRLPEGRAGTAQLEQYTDEIMLKMAQMLPPQYRGVYRERMKDEVRG
jgi:1-acyl-sn-glycerol-3-phosphate acyltransferase